MFQFNIVFGILVAFLSNALLKELGEDAWRWMLGVEAIPALLYTLFCLRIPESPRWLIGETGRSRAGRRYAPSSDHAEASEVAIQALADRDFDRCRAGRSQWRTGSSRPDSNALSGWRS